ncbi:MAG: OPT/YSL family transporter, partial [Saprospiraceae bacterium]|nr:OPT/YSL family transporter [Saprospiraceae bacterium]
IILLDKYQERRGSSWRFPVLAVAVGLYLPFELDSAIFVGGVIAWLVARYQSKRKAAKAEQFEKSRQASDRTGLLLASGLITGEALIGILLAVPIVLTEGKQIFQIVDQPVTSLLGLAVVIAVCYWLYNHARKSFDKA